MPAFSDWNPYGQRPIQYKKTFAKLARFIRAQTNMTAMLWAPNMGAGYPFTPSQYTPANTSAEWKALDTNNDGKVNEKDDPYTPYWPGADVVDWVAMSVCGFLLWWEFVLVKD